MRGILILLSLLVASSASAVEGGVLHLGDPAVGALTYGRSRCVATLVEPTVVLTAAHCVDNRSGFAPAASTFITNGGRGWVYGVKGALSFSDGTNATDIALVYLSTPVSGVRPMQMSTDEPVGNEELYVVGMGCSNMCPLVRSGRGIGLCGVRNSRMLPAGSLDLDYHTEAVQVCFGDSGGPLVNARTGKIVGVVSSFATAEINGRPYFRRSEFANVARWFYMWSGGK